jgi:hypothetical protein
MGAFSSPARRRMVTSIYIFDKIILNLTRYPNTMYTRFMRQLSIYTQKGHPHVRMEIVPQANNHLLEPFRVRHRVYKIPKTNMNSSCLKVVIPNYPDYNFTLKRSDQLWWYNYFRNKTTDSFTIRFRNGICTISFPIYK